MRGGVAARGIGCQTGPLGNFRDSIAGELSRTIRDYSRPVPKGRKALIEAGRFRPPRGPLITLKRIPASRSIHPPSATAVFVIFAGTDAVAVRWLSCEFKARVLYRPKSKGPGTPFDEFPATDGALSGRTADGK